MTVRVTFTWGHLNPKADTIWNRLADRLGREPTDAEATAEVKRILSEAKPSEGEPSEEGGADA